MFSLIYYLPRESSLARERGEWWTDEMEMAALHAEIAHEHMRIALAAAGVKKTKLPKALEIPRPGPPVKPRPRPKKRQATVEEVRHMLSLIHKQRG